MGAVPTETSRREVAVFVAAIIGIAGVIAIVATVAPRPATQGGLGNATPQSLSAFQSEPQLQQFIQANARSAQQYDRWGVGFGGPLIMNVNGAKGVFPVAGVTTFTALATMQASVSASAATPSFTGTNVQVQGVDEPDRVKTDGVYLFVSTQDSVAIIKAYPPNSTAVLAKLSFPNVQLLGLEAAQDRLMVIGQKNGVNQSVELVLYDVSNLSSPKMITNATIAGSYVAARMAEGFVYAVVQQPSYVFNNQGNATAVLPMASNNGFDAPIPASSVYYAGNVAQISYYTVIPSIAMSSGAETVKTVLTGPSATVYVSTSNIYVAYTNYPDLYSTHGILGDAYSGGVVSMSDVQQAQNSTVLRASYSGGEVSVASAGVVPGSVLNQFSLDEYNGYFRIATSRYAMVDGSPTRSDDVYVLDLSMNQVSALKNIAPGENLYAVRFVGAMGYVVTFEQIDPLFVISFKDITNPTILSALKVSGYSDYLHPLSGGYLIGVGKDAVQSSMANVAFYTSLKLSLFKVFDNGTSVQVSKLDIGDRGTDSPVLNDHLAFTYDPTRNITVIPLTLNKVSGNQTTCSGCPPPWGDPVWQGAYVIKVTDSGFKVLGQVSQYPAGQNFGDYPNDSLSIERSVIIGSYLYTISQSEVMVSTLDTFSTVATVPLPV
jgi:uncharacterized secreted protein with C-terminal beta-propeller domain